MFENSKGDEEALWFSLEIADDLTGAETILKRK